LRLEVGRCLGWPAERAVILLREDELRGRAGPSSAAGARTVHRLRARRPAESAHTPRPAGAQRGERRRAAIAQAAAQLMSNRATGRPVDVGRPSCTLFAHLDVPWARLMHKTWLWWTPASQPASQSAS